MLLQIWSLCQVSSIRKSWAYIAGLILAGGEWAACHTASHWRDSSIFRSWDWAVYNNHTGSECFFCCFFQDWSFTKGHRFTVYLSAGKLSTSSGRFWTMRNQRTLMIRRTIGIATQAHTLPGHTAVGKATGQCYLCPTITALIPSCTFLANYGQMTRGSRQVRAENWWWGWPQSDAWWVMFNLELFQESGQSGQDCDVGSGELYKVLPVHWDTLAMNQSDGNYSHQTIRTPVKWHKMTTTVKQFSERYRFLNFPSVIHREIYIL